jgi:hypothetical protein
MKIKICLALLIVLAAVSCLSDFNVAAAKTKTKENRFQTRQIFRCTVRDSTGTPLNVRSSPGGKKIVARLKNGTRVWVENFSGDAKDQSWAEVKLSPKRGAKALGWVLQDFLECDD